MSRAGMRRKRKPSRIVIGCTMICLVLIGTAIYGIWGGGLSQIAEHQQTTTNMVQDQSHEQYPASSVPPVIPVEEQQDSVKESVEQTAYKILDQMTLEQKVGQMLYVDLAAVMEGQTELNQAQALESLAPGGVILFRNQFQAIDDTVRTTALLNHLNMSVPVWIGTDQEGGLVTRVSYATDMNGNMALAATGKPDLTMETAQRTAEMLQKLGLNMNFAPVADVNVNPSNPVIGIRSFGASPELVGEFVQAYIEGMHKQGMPASVKHFPGHGDTAVDSHLGLPQLNHSKEEMERTDWIPFQSAIAADVDYVMTGHVTVPALDDTQIISKQDGQKVYVPATLSKPIITGVLREQLSYDGIIITDAMNMGAIASHFGIEDAALLAVEAGVDMLLMPPQPERVKQTLVKAVQEGRIAEARINESVLRILKLKAAYGLINEEGQSATVLTYDEQLEAAQLWQQTNDDARFALDVARQAITYTGDTSQLPILHNQVKRVVLLGTDSYALKAVSQAVRDSMSGEALSDARTLEVWMEVVQTEQEASNVLKQLDQQGDSDLVLIVSRDAQLSSSQKQLLQSLFNQLSKTKLKYGLLASSSPYDIYSFTDVPFSIATYGITEANMKAAAEQLWSKETTAARLPIH